jgi:hypothetical protein
MLISSGYERLSTYLAKKNIPFALYVEKRKEKQSPHLA